MKSSHSLLVYSALALALLAPMASEDKFLLASDHANHVAVIHQAAAALADGQFPIRSAPAVHGGVLYPLFQFYSPLPYTIAGSIHRYLFTASAYLSYKFALFVFLAGAGFAIRMAVLRLTENPGAAFVAGVSYLTMPYLIVNIQARGAFTEAIGQCVAAFVAWAVVEMDLNPSLRTFSSAAIAWCALATTHLITFEYIALSFCMAAASIAIWRGSLQQLFYFAGSLAGGAALAAWFLLPVAGTDYLVIRGLLPNPFMFRGFSPIEAVLSPFPVTPAAVLKGTPGFYSSAGLGTLGGVAICIGYSISSLRKGSGKPPFAVIFSLLAAFWIFVVVSPFDFWTRLPVAARVCQFSYRLLACVGICGALCAGMAYAAIVRSATNKLALGITASALLLAAVPFRSTALSNDRRPEQVAANPSIGYGSRDYLADIRKVALGGLPQGIPVPLLYGDHWIIHNRAVPIPIPAGLSGSSAVLEFSGELLPGLASASVSLVINGTTIDTITLKPDFGSVKVPLQVPSAASMTLELRSPSAVTPRELDGKSLDTRKLAIRSDRLTQPSQLTGKKS